MQDQICIGIGCDGRRSLFAREGFGKTSGSKTMAAFSGHSASGSRLVYDMEKAHRLLVRELDLVDEQHNAKLISKLDDESNPLREVNRLCFLMKLFFDSHSGFDREGLGGYLDLFFVIMNPPENKMEEAALVLERAMANPNTIRFGASPGCVGRVFAS